MKKGERVTHQGSTGVQEHPPRVADPSAKRVTLRACVGASEKSPWFCSRSVWGTRCERERRERRARKGRERRGEARSGWRWRGEVGNKARESLEDRYSRMSNSIIELGQHSERGKSEIQNLRTMTQGVAPASRRARSSARARAGAQGTVGDLSCPLFGTDCDSGRLPPAAEIGSMTIRGESRLVRNVGKPWKDVPKDVLTRTSERFRSPVPQAHSSAAARPIRPPQQAIGRLSAPRTQRRRLRARSHRRPARSSSSAHARASRRQACRADSIGPTARKRRNYILRIVLFIATRARARARARPPRPTPPDLAAFGSGT